jgi:hypothetical protein
MSPLEFYYNGNHPNPLLKEGHENHNKSIQKIEDILTRAHVNFDIVTRKELSNEFVSNYDTVISAGGDGTVIAVAAYNRDKSQLNLRTECHSIGALCQIDLEKSLENFLEGNYKIQNWTRADVFLNGNFVGRTLNEVCLSEKLRFDKYSKYFLSYLDKDSKLKVEEEQGGSGLIIATGTGSTAWPAAFKPFPRESDYFAFKTLLLHNGKIDSGFASDLYVIYKGHEGKFSIDTIDYDFPKDAILELKISEYSLRVIVPKIK